MVSHSFNLIHCRENSCRFSVHGRLYLWQAADYKSYRQRLLARFIVSRSLLKMKWVGRVNETQVPPSLGENSVTVFNLINNKLKRKEKLRTTSIRWSVFSSDCGTRKAVMFEWNKCERPWWVRLNEFVETSQKRCVGVVLVATAAPTMGVS